MIITHIHWRDAWSTAEEMPHADLGDLVDLYEVGFLIKETDEAVCLTCEKQGDDDAVSRWTVTIPKVNIVERYDCEDTEFIRWLKRRSR